LHAGADAFPDAISHDDQEPYNACTDEREPHDARPDDQDPDNALANDCTFDNQHALNTDGAPVTTAVARPELRAKLAALRRSIVASLALELVGLAEPEPNRRSVARSQHASEHTAARTQHASEHTAALSGSERWTLKHAKLGTVWVSIALTVACAD
jgi:hypothetical protein